MAKAMSRQELKRLAEIGARKRFDELQDARASLDDELAALVRTFPDLAKQAGHSSRRGGAGVSKKRTAARRGRKPMSDEQKQAHSERMKKFWQTRRRQKAKAAKA